MIPVDYELGKKIVESCTCECGAGLTLPWGGTWGINSYVIKCAVNPSHNKVVPIKSLTQLWQEGQPIPSFIADNIERKLRRKVMEQNEVKALVAKQDAEKLSTYLQPKFPKDLANRQAALDFARWCIAHQLEPIRDCIPYHGNPFITVEWADRQASQDEAFKGYSYHVFSQQEKEALDFDPKDIVIECQVAFDGLEKPLVGLGVVTRMEREAASGETDEVTARGYRSPVVHLHPQKMGFKRARAAALKQRYHIPAPILEELPYTTAVEAEYTVKEAFEGADRIGKQKGQPSRKPPDESREPPAAVQPKRDAKTAAPAELKDKTPDDITEDDLPDLNALCRVCYHFYKIQPWQVWKELGVKSRFDVTDSPYQAFLKIKALKSRQ